MANIPNSRNYQTKNTRFTGNRHLPNHQVVTPKEDSGGFLGLLFLIGFVVIIVKFLLPLVAAFLPFIGGTVVVIFILALLFA